MKQIEIASILNLYHMEPYPYFTINSKEVDSDQHLINGIIFQYRWLNVTIREREGELYVNVDKTIFEEILLKHQSVLNYLKKVTKNLLIHDCESLTKSNCLLAKDFFKHFDNINEVLLENSSNEPIFCKMLAILSEIQSVKTINLKSFSRIFVENFYFNHLLAIRDSNLIETIKRSKTLLKILNRTGHSVLLSTSEIEELKSFRSESHSTWPNLLRVKLCVHFKDKDILDIMRLHWYLLRPIGECDFYDHNLVSILRQSEGCVKFVFPSEEFKKTKFVAILPKNIKDQIKEELQTILDLPKDKRMGPNQILQSALWRFERNLFQTYSQDQFWDYIYKNLTQSIDRMFINRFESPDQVQKPYLGTVHRLLIKWCSKNVKFETILSLFPKVRNLSVGLNKNENWNHLNAKLFLNLDSLTLHLNSGEIQDEPFLNLNKILPSKTKKYVLIQSENGRRIHNRIQVNSQMMRSGWQVLRSASIFSFFQE